jgi:hypothetical protein
LPDKTQMTIFLPEKGAYYLNSTSEVQTNESSMMEVFDSKERLVFGLPVHSLPLEFDVDSAGFYSISLESVSMQGARLEVTEYAQNITLFSPYWYLSTPSKVMLIFGATVSSAIFVFYIATRSNDQRDHLRGFREFVEVSQELRIMCGTFSFILAPLAFYVILNAIFGHLPTLYLEVSFIVVLPIIAVYWLRFYDIVELFLSVFRYPALLSMKKILIYLMVLLLITYVPGFTALIWMTPMLIYNGAVIFVLFSVPLTAFIILLIPFMNPLASVGEARLALQEFLSDFRQNSRSANFKYVKEASKCLASIIGGNCSQVSCQAIERRITADIFAQANARTPERSDLLIQRIIAALNPFNLAALIGVVGETTDEEDRRARPRFDRMLELFTLLVSILGIIAYLLK